ncbi:MAG: hypothetical protein GXC76_14775 [Rhodanobacteraceae bacterium]|jgi:hypothetical protein|nr:hypothetical protein [Rhodanobacteraceae bacterium]
MNARLFLVPLALAAATASADASEPAPLQWDCARSGSPTLRETAKAFGHDNYSKVVGEREALHRQLRAICARGAQRVVVVPSTDRENAPEYRRIAGR